MPLLSAACPLHRISFTFRRLTAFLRRRHTVALTTVIVLATPVALAAPQIEQWTAASGAQVYFVQSQALPLLDVQVDFAAGSAYDPPGQAGLAAMTVSLLDAGAGKLDEQTIADRTADIGAQIGGSADDDRASLSIRSLSSATERDAAIELAATLLAEPTFPAEIVTRERNRSIAGLQEALMRPATLAARAFTAALYPGHPYGSITTVHSLKSIDRRALVNFHRTHFSASRATVAIVGDVDRATAESIAQRLTEGLPQAPAASALPQVLAPVASVVRIPNPSAQAHILVGEPGLARTDPDYFPLLVGNYVLGGGGFVSRLTREVREQRGFAYSVYSAFLPQQLPGPFQIGLQTRGDQADEALTVVRDTLDRFIAEGPSAEELQAAKDNLVNGFGLRLDANAKILGYVAMIGFYRQPLDWLDAYPRAVAAVSAEQVRDAFARRIHPQRMVTVIAGGDGANAGAEAGTAGQ